MDPVNIPEKSYAQWHQRDFKGGGPSAEGHWGTCPALLPTV